MITYIILKKKWTHSSHTCQHLQLASQQMATWCPETSLSPRVMLLSDKRPMLTCKGGTS